MKVHFGLFATVGWRLHGQRPISGDCCCCCQASFQTLSNPLQWQLGGKRAKAFKENQEINHEASSIRGIELQQLSSVLLLLLFEIITLLRREWKLSDHQAMSADRAFEGKMRL